MPRSLRRSALVASIALVLLAGCGESGAAKVRSKEVSHLRAVTALYFKASSALGKNPATEQEFKDVLAKDKMDLSVLGVSSVDELFVSDRDGQPLIITYGPAPKGINPSVVAYEQVGLDGIRLVGFKSGQIEEADAARFAALVSPAPK